MSRFENDLTKGNVAGQLLRFSMPFLLSNLIQALYSMADLYIVSLVCPTGSVVGVNVGGQVSFLITNLAIGLALGGTVVLAQYAGAKKDEDMKQTVSTLLTLLIGGAVVLTAAALLCCDHMLRLLNTPDTAFAEAGRYFRICMWGNIFVFGYNAISAILRALGDSKRPLIFVSISCGMNILLDLLLVCVFGMGAGGAALATIASQAFSMLLAIITLNRSDFFFSFSLKNLRIYGDKLGKILKMGIPSSIQSVLINISFLIITSMTNTFGEAAAAGVAAVSKVNTFCILPSIAIGQSVSPMAAQNIGAGHYDRAKRSMWAGVIMNMVIGVIMFGVMQYFSPALTGLFANDPLTREQVIAYGTQYARAMSYDYFLIPFCFCMTNFVNGAGHARTSLIANTLSALLLRVPAAYILGMLMHMGLRGFGFAIPVSTVGTLIYVGIFIASGRWKRSTLGIAEEAALEQ